jgi:hypothetical protein
MGSVSKRFGLGVPTGWADVGVRAAKAAVIAFVALQTKEWLDTSMLDIPGCGVDALWVGGLTLAVDAILMWAGPSAGRQGAGSA